MEKSEIVMKMEESAKGIFGTKFVRFGQNIHNDNLGYVAINGKIFGSDIRGLEYQGYKITCVEATEKNCLIIHLREKMGDEK